MSQRKAQLVRIGILVPSSNTALEPLTSAIIASLCTQSRLISVHFSRFSVTRINLTEQASAQFNPEVILSAAQLLLDTKVDVIGWSGTSAGWLGFETDEVLVRTIQKRTKTPATTSTLALNKALEIFGVKSLGLVTPYIPEMNEAIIKNYAGIGVEIPKACERHLGIVENNAIVEVDESTLDSMMRDVMKEQPQAVTTFCTNLRAAQRVQHWENEYGMPVFDTVSTVVWDCLRIAGVDTSQVKGWGRMFEKQ